MSVPPAAVGCLVVPCGDLDRSVDACLASGLRLDAIGPADEPTWAELSIPGLRLRLELGNDAEARPRLRLPAPGDGGQAGAGPDQAEAGPDQAEAGPELGALLGLSVETVAAPGQPPVDRPDVPPTVQALAVGHEADGTWKEGRAGMRYRDLIPNRHGGAYIASHIHVPHGGPVADYVHHHDVVHQLIFCHRGWVRVVYQDQGPPFVLEPGDCVLQPPGIRHRVLESSDDLYVVEVGCPAVHRTSVDHELDLPNRALEPDRRYGDQRFVRHVSSRAPWVALDGDHGLLQQGTGLAGATAGLVSARLLRAAAPVDQLDLINDDDLRFLFLVEGAASLAGLEAGPIGLAEGSSAAIPAGADHRLTGIEAGTVIFEVRAAAPPRADAAT